MEKRVLGIIAGSGLLKSSCLGSLKKLTISTPFGDVFVQQGEGFYVIQRHGADPQKEYSQPGEINYRANVTALKELGVTHCIMFCSVGSLRSSLPIGSLVIGDDFFNLWSQISLFSDYRSHIAVGLDENFRKSVLDALTKELKDVNIVDGGTYVQTPGPRFETKAEIRVIKNYGDMVGMTAGHEITLLSEAQIKTALIGCIDNMANGIEEKTISIEEYRKGVAKNLETLETVFSIVHRSFC